MSNPGDLDYLTDRERDTLDKGLLWLTAFAEMRLADLTPEELQEIKSLGERFAKCAGIALLAK